MASGLDSSLGGAELGSHTGNSAAVLRVGAVGDLHCNKDNTEALRALLGRGSAEVDVLLLCGDLLDHGTLEEGRLLAREITVAARVPVVAVLGNHDFEAGHERELTSMLQDVGVHMLDGESCEVGGVGFAGVKGFAGGFGAHSLGAWGESAIKAFVHETIDEALKLESALARLTVPARVVVLHYAPIAATVQGESPEIFPFLGSSRLEEPINRYPVAAVFHGHAHCGVAEGQTSAKVPVYNVAAPVLQRDFPGRPPYRIVAIAADAGAVAGQRS